jgi:TP901 family phage tail tape measure protein
MSSSMRLNLIMGMVDKITGPIQKVTSETDRMGRQVTNTQAQLSKLGNTSKDIANYRGLEERSAKTAAALAQAQAKAAALGREMSNTGAPTRKLTTDFERARAEVKRLQDQQQTTRVALQQTSARLKEAGASTTRLDEATRRVTAQTRAYAAQLEREKKALAEVAEREKQLAAIRTRNSDMRKSATMDAVGVGAAVFGVKKLVDAYGEVATAQGEIASLGIDTRGIDAITAKAKMFSNQWSGTSAPEFIRASYDVKSAISSLGDEAVGSFTAIAALTAKATKSSTAEMTKLMASGYGIYRRQFDTFGAEVVEGWQNLSQEERDIKFGEYFASGIAATVQMFKTDGSQMSQALSSLGATATSAGISYAEQLAILGQLQTTMSGSEAATKYRAFMGKAAEAGEKLGLSFLDAEDRLKTMPEVLTEIRDKYGDTIDAIEAQELQKAFGTTEAVALIQQLYPEIDSLRGNIDGLNTSLAGGMEGVEKMASSMNAGPSEAFQVLSQRTQNASAAIGKVFAPSMMAAAGALGTVALFVSGLAERFPFLTQVLAYAVVGLIALKMASIAARFSFAFFSDALLLARKTLMWFTVANLRAQAALLVTRIRTMAATVAMVAMSAASRAVAIGAAIMTGAQWALNAAMMANPIGLVVAGILALIAVVALVVKYWEPLGEFFSGVWDGIVAIGARAWDALKSLLSFTPLGLLIKAWEPLTAFFSGIWAGISMVFSAAWNFIKALMNFAFVWAVVKVWEPLLGFFSGLWERIKAVFVAAWGVIKTLLSYTPLGLLIQAWEPLVNFFSGLWDRIKAVFTGATEWLANSVLAPIMSILDKVGGFFSNGAVAITQTINDATASVNTAAMVTTVGAAAGAGEAPVVHPGGVGSVVSPAGRPTNPPAQVNQYGDIVVHGAPGMSEEEVAKQVRAQLEARDRQAATRQRGRLGDDRD